jgi:hypothetical protein
MPSTGRLSRETLSCNLQTRSSFAQLFQQRKALGVEKRPEQR